MLHLLETLLFSGQRVLQKKEGFSANASQRVLCGLNYYTSLYILVRSITQFRLRY